ncbi:hypothetical protein [Rathayibacter tritici]|nr:hypothetical protein [Rathayibacter tritici]
MNQGASIGEDSRARNRFSYWLHEKLSSGAPLLDREFDVIVGHVQHVGKHHLEASTLDGLAALRERRPRTRMSEIFLDSILDKHDGRYDYPSYASHGLLHLLLERHAHPVQVVRLLVQDIIAHETAEPPRWIIAPPDANLVARRCRIAARTLKELERVSKTGEHVQIDDTSAALIASSVFPVDQWHDEYMFIRILQSYECVFAVLLTEGSRALDALQRADPHEAARSIRAAAATIDSAGRLFTLMATMRREAFSSFRVYTEGASAIQSRRYKQFELLCGRPEPTRLASEAFASVPDVQVQATGDPATLTSAFLNMPDPASGQRRQVVDAMLELEQAHNRWKQTHYSLGVRFVGPSRGSGGTSGVEYLDHVRANRLFWKLELED